MNRTPQRPLTATGLRRELSSRNLDRAADYPHELTYGGVPSVVYTPAESLATHGNFLPASYRRIVADVTWSRRLGKSYSASARIPRRGDRVHRGELDCAASSDALLMNLFCYPGVLRRPAVCALLGVPPGLRPQFGVRTEIPLLPGHRALPDRTEADLLLGDLLIEAKLTETGFGQARPALLTRYQAFETVFDPDELSRTATGSFRHYQLLRGALAAHGTGGRFALLCDARRQDLAQAWFEVLRAIRSADLRSRLTVVTWQELGSAVPAVLRRFLAEKYGILPAAAGPDQW